MAGAISRAITALKQTESLALRDLLLRARGGVEYARHGHAARRRITRRYLAETAEPMLQIGTGPNSIPGWLNSDLISGDVYIDLGRPLPLPDASFQYVFGEHIIEHIPERAGVDLMRELHRILRPGGVARLVTPDLEKLIAIYEDRNDVVSLADYTRFLDEMTGKRHERRAQVFNDYMRLWGHRYIYDEEDLVAKLREAGFADVKRVESGESEHEALRGIERHGERFGAADWENRAEAVCVEATKAG